MMGRQTDDQSQLFYLFNLGGRIPANHLLRRINPVATRVLMGLIISLGEWVLRTACAEAATWPNEINVSVNVSSLQLNNKTLINVVISALASARLPANRLEIEVTETVFFIRKIRQQRHFAFAGLPPRKQNVIVEFGMTCCSHRG